MHANSPPGHVFALDWSALQRPEISFYTLWEGPPRKVLTAAVGAATKGTVVPASRLC